MLHILCKQGFMFNLCFFFHGGNAIFFVIHVIKPLWHLVCKVKILRPHMWLSQIMHLLMWLALNIWVFLIHLEKYACQWLIILKFVDKGLLFNPSMCTSFMYVSSPTTSNGGYLVRLTTCKLLMVLLLT